MKKKKITKQCINTLLAFLMALLLLVSPFGIPTAQAAGEVCTVNGTPYVLFGDAMAAIAASSETDFTVTLLNDINYPAGLLVDTKNITFELEGFTLDINNSVPNGTGLTVRGGGSVTTADTTGIGRLNVTGTGCGVMAEAGSSASVNSVTSNETLDSAVIANGGSTVTVNGDVTALEQGVYAVNDGSKVEVNGDVTVSSTSNYYTIWSELGSQVLIHGNVTGSDGVIAVNSGEIEVDGTVTASADTSYGAYAKDLGYISIGAGVTGKIAGAYADTLGTVIVKSGDSAADSTISGSFGAHAVSGGKVEVQNGNAIGETGAEARAQDSSGNTPSSIYINGDSIGARVGVNADISGVVHATGNVTADLSDGVYAGNASIVTVDGNVSGVTGVYAETTGTEVTVSGNVSSSGMTSKGVYASEANVTVAGSVTATGGSSTGAYATDSGSVSIGTDVTGGLAGASADYLGTIIVQNGDCTATASPGGIGAIADHGGKVEVQNGDAKGSAGAWAQNTYDLTSSGTRSSIYINGNSIGTVVAVDANNYGVVHVTGDVSADEGIYAGISSNVTVDGDVSGGTYGVYVEGTDANVIVDGQMSAADYIFLNFTIKTADDAITNTPELPGYFTYTDGTSSVYVKNALTVTTDTPQITGNTASLSGSFDAGTGLAAAVNNRNLEAGFVYSTSHSPALGAAGVTDIPASLSMGSFTAAIQNLPANTTYYVRAYATNDAGTVYGDEAAVTAAAIHTGGGGSSSSSGGSAPKQVLTAKIIDSTGNLCETVSASLDASTGIVKSEADQTALTAALNNSKADGKGVKTVIFDITGIAGAKAFESGMPASFFADRNPSGAVQIKTDLAAVTLPGNMLTTAETAGAKSVSLTVAAADKSKLSQEVRSQIGDRPVVELGLKIDGKQASWSSSNASVTVSIPYKPTAAELADAEHIVVWYVDGSGSAVSVPNGRYNPATGTVTFTTTHFSSYAAAFVHKSFGDLSSTEWARQSIEIMASKGIISGTGENTFSPSANISRADYLVLLVKTLGLTADVDSNFADVEPGAYYYEAVGIAKKLGIAAGSGNNRFNPKDNITRQDMMVLTASALEKFKGLKVTADLSVLDKFSDKADIAGYATGSLATLVKEGLIAGSGAAINPRANTTRAEAAVFLYRVYNKFPG